MVSAIWGKPIPAPIGKGRIKSDKREGDGATPRGIHRIVGMLYRPVRFPKPNHWAKSIGPKDLPPDDTSDAHYNHYVKRPYAHNHERLCRSDPLYDRIILTDWNWPHAQAGKGSAIFIHEFRLAGYPTEGCIAFRLEHLHATSRPTHG
jgi:L,D-peptidoglycan transpeptidase YkuD (ErfK/YbiS/YcfS/YnhG family)